MRQFDIITDEAVECQTIGHAWDDISGIAQPTQGRLQFLHGDRFVFRCTRCGTERREVWSIASGQLMMREYRYPEQFSAGKFKPKGKSTRRETFRLEYIDRKVARGDTKRRRRVE